ncbi:MAG: hypothetical protein Ct9H300mP12_10800 [Acidimicrobiales bacterium]|nr:MAG: hypothetical protein Ct9H300mP12_10800 [Acidimicrobiales bacterium]
MLRDSGPVMTLPGMIPSRANADAHLVGRHADVVTVLRNPDIFSSRFDAVHIGQVRPLIPLQVDPPDHAKYRKLLDPLFAPRRIALLEDRTRALVSDLVETVADTGGCNFHAAVSEPLPSTVFLNCSVYQFPAPLSSLPSKTELSGQRPGPPRNARTWSMPRVLESTPSSKKSSTND